MTAIIIGYSLIMWPIKSALISYFAFLSSIMLRLRYLKTSTASETDVWRVFCGCVSTFMFSDSSKCFFLHGTEQTGTLVALQK